MRKIKSKNHIDFSKNFGEMKKQCRIKHCLWNDSCSDNIVSAHSIQENGILSKIADNGKIFMFKYYIDEKNEFHTVFEEEGKNKFSTFMGFCGIHDKEIFAPIEDKAFITSDEQFYLFAFRAISREYHINIEKSLMDELVKKKAIEKGNYDFNKYEIEKAIENTKVNLKKFKEIFNFMKMNIENKSFQGLKTRYIEYDKEYLIASNCCFLIYFDFNKNLIFNDEEYQKIQTGEINPLIMFNMFPKEGKTHILISYFSENTALSFLEDVKITQQDISNLLVYNAENTAYSPPYIKENFSKDEIALLEYFFNSNLRNALYKPYNVPNLFR